MTTHTATLGAPPTSMRRIARASMAGTVIEFYDFIIYGTAAALVFSKVFFPQLGTAAGTAVAFATTGVAFVARPLGSLVFGHFGDRLGRKKTLVATLLLMGCATVAIGLVPTTATIGAAAPVLLVVLRVLQGLAIGGEWAGATLLAAENAPTHLRGRYSLYPQLGPSVGLSLASGTFLVIALTMSPEAFVAWGWRVPFLLSAVLVIVGLYVRLNIEESKVFRNTLERRETVRVPLIDTLRHQSKELALGALTVTTPFAFFYIGAIYLTNFGATQLDLPRTTVLAAGVLGGASFAVTTIIGSVLSDRTGRRKMIVLGSVLAAITGLIVFPIIDVGTPEAFVLGLCMTTGCMGFAYGPVGALLPELFATRYRYTGAGFAYNLAGILGGAVIPLLATQLHAGNGNSSVGFLLTGIAVVSALAVLALPETKPSVDDTAAAPAAAAT